MLQTPSGITISVAIAVVLFAFGLALKISTWFRHTVGIDGSGISAWGRVRAALIGVGSTLISRRIFTLIRVFFLDVVIGWRLLRRDRYRWLMHTFIYGGFVMLILMHALGAFTSFALFPDYTSTLNPFLFLRDLFGVLVIAGIALALYRRFGSRRPRSATSRADVAAMFILVLILSSGFLLQATKTLSRSSFDSMVDAYSIGDSAEETAALERYWVEEFGLAPPKGELPLGPQAVETGRALHEMNCAQCHSRPQWAFGSYAASRVLAPLSPALEAVRMPAVLWHLHFLSALVALVLLPFTKMFHMVAGPLSLLMNAVMERGKANPANVATRQMIELDACTHCGACTSACAVAVAFEVIPNVNILPSEKIASLKKLASVGRLCPEDAMVIQQGLVLCTNCNRCTEACPVGIDLWTLWLSARERLLAESRCEFFLLSPLSLHRGLLQEWIESARYRGPVEGARQAVEAVGDPREACDRIYEAGLGDRKVRGRLEETAWANNFSHCYTCVTCSNSCPVVHHYRQPMEALGLMPHQIMHAVGLRLWDLIFSSRMLWDCLGCYQCQENCPQGVCVADILCELKSLAILRAEGEVPAEEQGRPQ